MSEVEYTKELHNRMIPVLDNILALKGIEYADVISMHGAFTAVTNMLLASQSMQEVKHAVSLLVDTQATLLLTQARVIVKLRGKGAIEEVALEILEDYDTIHKQIATVRQNANSR
jgi:hypothetical protein